MGKQSTVKGKWLDILRVNFEYKKHTGLLKVGGLYEQFSMGLLPDTYYCRCACTGNAGNVFPATTGKRSRHASRHVRHARAVMNVGIAN